MTEKEDELRLLCRRAVDLVTFPLEYVDGGGERHKVTIGEQQADIIRMLVRWLGLGRLDKAGIHKALDEMIIGATDIVAEEIENHDGVSDNDLHNHLRGVAEEIPPKIRHQLPEGMDLHEWIIQHQDKAKIKEAEDIYAGLMRLYPQVVGRTVEMGFGRVLRVMPDGIWTGKVNREGEWTPMRKIFSGRPEEVTVAYDHITHETMWDFVWKAHGRPNLHLTDTVSGIIDRLNEAGLIWSARDARDVLVALIDDMIAHKHVRSREITQRPGYYLMGHEIQRIGDTDGAVTDRDELKAQLVKLNKVIMTMFPSPAKTATVIKWMLFAPFSYIWKTELRKRFKWMYLEGPSYTGKTTVASIGLGMWGMDDAASNTGWDSVNTPYRMGEKIGTSTYPLVVNETGDLWDRSKVLDIVKNSIDKAVARSTHQRGLYRDKPALAPVCFTSNQRAPGDAAIRNRFIVLAYSFDERVSRAAARRFRIEDWQMPAIGPAVARYIAEAWHDHQWQGWAHKIDGEKGPGMDWRTLVEGALYELYTTVGLKVPDWVEYGWTEELGWSEEDTGIDLSMWMVGHINDMFSRHIRTMDWESVSGSNTPAGRIREKLEALAEGGYIPWLHTTRSGRVYIHPGKLKRVLRSDVRDAVISSEENMRQLMLGQVDGMKIKPRKFAGKSVKVMECSVDDLVEWLIPDGEDIPQPTLREHQEAATEEAKGERP